MEKHEMMSLEDSRQLRDKMRFFEHELLGNHHIDPNLYGRINQNYGYAGYEKNEPPISSLEELEASGQ